jgi:Ca2+-binding EF-hand superfamily protein
MTIFKSRANTAVVAVTLIAAVVPLSAVAQDAVVAFATGGYASGLRTKEMMSIIDTDGDGMISRAEWNAFQEKVFNALDSHKRGKLDTKIFARRTEARITTLATGGYARGLDSTELARKIDTNGDGWITHDEWMTYQGKIFDLMNTSVTHKGEIGHEEMFATGGANRP